MERLAIILDGVWRLKDTSGNTLQQSLRFHSDGDIDGSSHPNESFWKIDGDLLYIFDNNMQPVSVFDEFFELGNGFYQFLGSFSGSQGNRKNIILESLSDKNKVSLSEFAVEAKLGKKTQKLLVQINSVATVYDGNNHKREFNYLTNLAGIDIVRISQSLPLYWYCNILNELEHIISGYIHMGYDQVFILGSSAGGYASLMLAEKLASRFTQTEFTTFTINPQTTLEKNVIDEILIKYDGYFIHQDIIDHSLLARRQDASTSVSEFLKVPKSNINHQISYDSLNPVEVHYCNLLKSSSRVYMHEYNLGVSHGQGCTSIGDSQAFSNLLLKTINNRIL